MSTAFASFTVVADALDAAQGMIEDAGATCVREDDGFWVRDDYGADIGLFVRGERVEVEDMSGVVTDYAAGWDESIGGSAVLYAASKVVRLLSDAGSRW